MTTSTSETVKFPFVIFPIESQGKLYRYKECDKVFLETLSDLMESLRVQHKHYPHISLTSLQPDGSIYVGSGKYIYPDGHIETDGR